MVNAIPKESTNDVIGQSVTAISPIAAQVSFASAAMFVVLLTALHIIKPELDPSWRFISEYALGKFGWIMTLAFLSLAVSFIAIFVAARSQLHGFAGKIGLVALLISALGLIIAAMFVTDPITTGPDAETTSGALHNFGGTLGICMPIAVALVSWKLVRNPAWVLVRRSIAWAAGLALFGFLVAFVALGFYLSQSNGRPGPDALVGWPMRFEIVADAIWLMVVARQAVNVASVTVL